MNEYYSVVRSPDYLEHFGILGMKWGIRRFQNKDGSLTPEGQERYNKHKAENADKAVAMVKGNYSNLDTKSINKIFELVGADTDKLEIAEDIAKGYGKSLSELYDKSYNVLKDFDDKTKTYYESVTELAENCMYNKKDPNEATMEDIGNAGFMGCLEDGQQQQVNANSYYIFEKGLTEEAKNISKEYNEIWRSSNEKVREEVKSALQEVDADIPISEKNPNYTLSQRLSSDILGKGEDYARKGLTNDHKSADFYRVLDGTHSYTDDELKAVDKAKKVIDHIEGNKDYNTWWYFNEAAENLGMSNIKASEMTQADYDRLNAEIRDLRSARHSGMTEEEYLEHHGILGQRWGIRRYQNPDGSLTEEGRRRYGDILTPDQMKKIIHDYNLRTGQNKKLNKKTVFKTSHGMYDYKGRRLNDDTDVAGPDKNSKKSESKEDSRRNEISEMSTEEIKNANARMEAEIDYIRKYNQLHPQQVSAAKQIVENLKSHLINDIPSGISQGVKQYISNSIASLADDGKSGDGDKKSEKKKKNNGQNQTTAQKAVNTVKNMSAVKETAEAVKDIAKEYNDTKVAMANAATNARSAATNASNNVRSVVNDTKQMFRDKVSNADFEDSIVDDEFIRLYKERYKPLL